jgi:hypothetical protein
MRLILILENIFFTPEALDNNFNVVIWCTFIILKFFNTQSQYLSSICLYNSDFCKVEI